jgi:hypothetical protein
VTFGSSKLMDGQRMLEILTDNRKYAAFCPKEEPLLSTSSYGVSYRESNSVDGLPHVDKALSIFAELGIRTNLPVRTAEGDTFTLRAALDDAVMNFHPKQELPWTAIALAHYLPPVRSWRNKFGDEYTFDDLAMYLVEAPYAGSACAGTHLLSALTHLVRVNSEIPVLSPSMRDRALARLRDASMQLEAKQRTDGSWPFLWYSDDRKQRGKGELHPRIEDIRVVGHHLEWIAIAPIGARPSQDCIGRALTFLSNRLLNCSESEREGLLLKASSMSPISHAVRAMSLYRHVSLEHIVQGLRQADTRK